MQTAVIPLSSAVLLRGQRAWTRIKSTAAEQRQLWREVGQALLEGRRANPSNQAFGAWCKAHGFDMAPPDRSDAMWFASYDGHKTAPPDLTHPHRIRQWAREQADTTEAAVTAEPDAPVIAAATAVLKNQRRLAAVDAHRKGIGPEAETAKRQFAKTAETLGVSQDQLSTLIDKMDPFGKMAPELRAGLQSFMNDVRNFTKDLKVLVETSKGVVTPEYLVAFITAELKG